MSAGGGVSAQPLEQNWSREQIFKLKGEAVWLPHGRHADRLFERVAVPREHGKKGVDVSTGYTESRNSIRPQWWREEMPPSSNNLVESAPEFYISKGNGDGNNDASVGNLQSDFISLAFLQLQSDTVHDSILINLI